jgi:hypothetical protein
MKGGGVEIWLHSVFISALDGGEWSSLSGHFATRKESWYPWKKPGWFQSQSEYVER